MRCSTGCSGRSATQIHKLFADRLVTSLKADQQWSIRPAIHLVFDDSLADPAAANSQEGPVEIGSEITSCFRKS
jgi:hypothetical protein